MSYRYYEGTLSSAEREAYRAMRSGLSSYETSFSVPRLDTRRLGEIFSMVKLDDPLIFHTGSLSFVAKDGASNITVKPVYSMKKQEYSSTVEIVKKRVRKVMAPADGFLPIETEKYIHDYIVRNVRYDKLKKTYSHEVTGPLCHGIGVCEGMSKVFKLLCDAAGIECLVVTGIGVPPNAATGKKSERHAWNIVIINGVAAALDVTFDASLSSGGRICRAFFNVSDEVMRTCHGSEDFPVPRCPGSKPRREV